MGLGNLLQGQTIGDPCLAAKCPLNVFDDFMLSRRQQAAAIAMLLVKGKSWCLTAPLHWAVEQLSAIRGELK